MKNQRFKKQLIIMLSGSILLDLKISNLAMVHVWSLVTGLKDTQTVSIISGSVCEPVSDGTWPLSQCAEQERSALTRCE